MKLLSPQHLAIGLAMIAAAGLALAIKPSAHVRDKQFDLERIVPASFDDWRLDPKVMVIPPSPDVKANLDKIYDQMVNRTYVNSRGERIMLSVAYGGDQSDNLKAHRQEVCYTAQGFQIRSLIQGALQVGQSTIPVTRMYAVNGQRTEPVTYWFTMGDKVVLGRFERMLVQIKYGLSGGIPDGMLVRVSNISSDPASAFFSQDEFVRQLLHAVAPKDVARLVGGVI